MITVQNGYEPIIYEQHFTSHIYENQLELRQNYYTRPISNNVPVEQEVKLKLTLHLNPKKTKYKAQVQTTFIKMYKKNSQEKKFGQFHFS